jgi:hypothetical protein
LLPLSSQGGERLGDRSTGLHSCLTESMSAMSRLYGFFSIRCVHRAKRLDSPAWPSLRRIVGGSSNKFGGPRRPWPWDAMERRWLHQKFEIRSCAGGSGFKAAAKSWTRSGG